MSSRLERIFVALLFFSGCLQEGPAPKGRLLFHGQHVESPAFITVGSDEMVRFEDRISYASATQGGVSDLWISSLDGTSQRKVVSHRSDLWPEQGPDNAGDRYFMVDEHLVPSNGSQARAATLVRLGPTLDEEFRLEEISSYTRFSISIGGLFENPLEGQPCPGFPSLKDDCPQLFYERPLQSGGRYPTLMLWDGVNHLPLGLDSNSLRVQTLGNNAYFVLDDQHVLTRFRRPSYALESLRANVGQFSVSGDERYAALSVTDDKTKTVVRELKTGREIPLMRPNPSSWGIPDHGLFGSRTFYYSQNATSTAPAEWHTLDLDTGEDTFDTLPSPLTNCAGKIDRPGSDERLILDSAGHGVFTNKSDLVGKRVLQGPLYTPSFTSDGKYLVYISPAAPTLYDTSVQGPLMFQDADQIDQPPTMVSPPGLLVNVRNGTPYFFTSSEKGPLLVFWAHLGRSSSDLYFADYTEGSLPTNLRLIAKSILSVSVSAHTLFGVVNMSQQDGVGDLVSRDIDTGTDTLYAQAVLDATSCPQERACANMFLYIVRGRSDSDRSGLWIDSLTQADTPDGGRD
jgi:hypothetical protein